MNRSCALIILSTLLISLYSREALSQQRQMKLDSSSYKPNYDLPLDVPHGTWDFDEWPGVDHSVVYKKDFLYNNDSTDQFKIDYTNSLFDEDDHCGYLRTPLELESHGFKNISSELHRSSPNKLIGIFTHPDDELLLAGGLLTAAKNFGWDVKVYLVSNGADGSFGEDSVRSLELNGFNAFGVTRDYQLKIVTDIKADSNRKAIDRYAKILNIPIEIIRVDFSIGEKRIVQLGDASGTEPRLTYNRGSPFRDLLRAGIWKIIDDEQPQIVITHGSDGEYGNYFHCVVHDLVCDIVMNTTQKNTIRLFTGFPEFNIHDHITHYLDLSDSNRVAWITKYDALRSIPYLNYPGTDYDKPWDPHDSFPDGLFVKDYGYTPQTGEPPRYEFFSEVDLKK